MIKTNKIWRHCVSVAHILTLLVFVTIAIKLYTPLKKFLRSSTMANNHVIDSSVISTSTELVMLQDVLTQDDDVQTIYQMLKDVTEVLDAANIEYVADGGTMLGTMRHKGLIPWDDDVDLIILKPDEEKFLKLKSVFLKLGYDLVEFHPVQARMYKICPLGNPVSGFADKDRKIPITYPFIDIFIMYHNKDTDVIEYSDAENQKIWPLAWFPHDIFFPLSKYKFGPLLISGINNPKRFLDNFYGSDWESVAVISPKHFKSNHSSSIRTKMTEELFKPALPKEPLLNRMNPSLRQEIIQNMN